MDKRVLIGGGRGLGLEALLALAGFGIPRPYIGTSAAEERRARKDKTPADLEAMAKAEAKRERKAEIIRKRGHL